MEESQDLAAAIARRLSALQTYSLPQLAGWHSDTALYDELAGDISQNTQIIEAEIEQLTLLADEAEDDVERQRILHSSASFASEFRLLRLQCGKALLTARQRLAGHSASVARQQLMASPTAPVDGNGGTPFANAEDELMSRTADVTNGLRKTRQLLQQELDRSSLSMQILERSTTSLNQTTTHYSSFSSLLDTSKRLITAMEKADVFDRLLLLAAIVFFALVCALIIKRRLVDRGIRAASLFSRLGGKAVHYGQVGYGAIQQKVTAGDDDATSNKIVAGVTLSAVSLMSTAAASFLSGTRTSSLHRRDETLGLDERAAFSPAALKTPGASGLLHTDKEPTFMGASQVSSDHVIVSDLSVVDVANYASILNSATPATTPAIQARLAELVADEVSWYGSFEIPATALPAMTGEQTKVDPKSILSDSAISCASLVSSSPSLDSISGTEDATISSVPQLVIPSTTGQIEVDLSGDIPQEWPQTTSAAFDEDCPQHSHHEEYDASYEHPITPASAETRNTVASAAADDKESPLVSEADGKYLTALPQTMLEGVVYATPEETLQIVKSVTQVVHIDEPTDRPSVFSMTNLERDNTVMPASISSAHVYDEL